MASELKFKYDFMGSPGDFALGMGAIERELLSEFGRTIAGTFEDIGGSLDSGLWIVNAWFIPIEGKIAKGTITVKLDLEEFPHIEQIHPDDRYSELEVTLPKEDADRLWSAWEVIRRKLEQRGYLHSLGETPGGEEIKHSATDETPIRKAAGHPGIGHEERVYRMSKAQEAIKLRRDNPELTWKEIAVKIDFRPGGTLASKVALLLDARHRLERSIEGGESELLSEVDARTKQSKEMKKTD